MAKGYVLTIGHFISFLYTLSMLIDGKYTDFIVRRYSNYQKTRAGKCETLFNFKADVKRQEP